MPSITLTFSYPIQDSVQIGDIIYYCNTNTVGGFSTSNTIKKMGACTALTEYTLTCDIPSDLAVPTSNDFIMFSKDNRANASTMTGYFAEVDLRNNDHNHAEVYHVSTEIFESSK